MEMKNILDSIPDYEYCAVSKVVEYRRACN